MRAIRLTRANWLNDEVAGDPGTVKVVSDEMAYGAVEVHRIAVYAPEHDPSPEPLPLTMFVGPEAAAKRLDELIDHIELVADGGYGPEGFGAPGVVEMKRPYGNASKADWIAWAVHNGADEAEVAGWTKNQLMGTYGERL